MVPYGTLPATERMLAGSSAHEALLIAAPAPEPAPPAPPAYVTLQEHAAPDGSWEFTTASGTKYRVAGWDRVLLGSKHCMSSVVTS